MYFSISISPQSLHAGGTPAPHSSLWVRAPPARISAASAPGARASGAHAGGTPAHPGLDAIAPPGLPGAQRGLQPAVSAGGQDARAPRTRRHSPAGASRRSARASARSLRRRARRPHPIQVHGCARLRRAYQQRLLQVRAPPARMRAGTPAHPGLDAIAPPGLPGAQRGLQPAV